MPNGIRLILHFIALAGTAAVGFWFLARQAAPAHDAAAVGVGFFLPSFGAFAAKVTMELVVLPLAVLSMLKRVFAGRKPMVINAPKRDPLERFGRALFVTAYAGIAGGTGFVAGWMGEGGWGALASGAAFAGFGAMLAMLVPDDILWAAGDNEEGEPTAAARAAHAQARRDGDPFVLGAERAARKIIDATFEDQRGR